MAKITFAKKPAPKAAPVVEVEEVEEELTEAADDLPEEDLEEVEEEEVVAAKKPALKKPLIGKKATAPVAEQKAAPKKATPKKAAPAVEEVEEEVEEDEEESISTRGMSVAEQLTVAVTGRAPRASSSAPKKAAETGEFMTIDEIVDRFKDEFGLESKAVATETLKKFENFFLGIMTEHPFRLFGQTFKHIQTGAVVRQPPKTNEDYFVPPRTTVTFKMVLDKDSPRTMPIKGRIVDDGFEAGEFVNKKFVPNAEAQEIVDSYIAQSE